MIGKLVRSKITQQLQCDHVRKLPHRVQPRSLTSVFLTDREPEGSHGYSPR